MSLRHIKRSSALIFYYSDGQFVGENYVSGKLSVLSGPVLGILDHLQTYRAYTEVVEQLAAIPEVEGLLQSLLDRDILVSEDSPLAQKEETLDSWEWDLPARHFHAKTNYVNFEANNSYVLSKLDEKAEAKTPPSPYLVLPNVTYEALPPPGSLPEVPIQDALLSRRTCRNFTGEGVSRQQLSNLLYYSFGKTGEFKGGSIGDVVFKTSPSGGSRHPAEPYVIIHRAVGFAPGLYHYSVKDHSLGLLKEEDLTKWTVDITSKQEWVGDAAVVCLLTSVLKRNMWKYENSHAYRVINMDLGHLGQTFHLVCTAMGLGPFTTAALNCRMIEEKLQNDPYLQPALYVCAAGWPENDGVPYQNG